MCSPSRSGGLRASLSEEMRIAHCHGVATWRSSSISVPSCCFLLDYGRWLMVASVIVVGTPANNSFERTRPAAVARFAVRRWWRAAQLMSR